jgi:hypothetical protein
MDRKDPHERTPGLEGGMDPPSGPTWQLADEMMEQETVAMVGNLMALTLRSTLLKETVGARSPGRRGG